MKRSIPFSVGVILVLVSTQIVVTSSDMSSYDIMADLNRDRIVNANDLARLGNAYGSRLILPSEPNKAVVTVLSYDKNPPEVENARVAIFDTDLDSFYAVAISTTNSSGIVTFELCPNKNYTSIAWYGSAYNYANFTTDLLGEAAILILLGEPSLPPIQELPDGWIVVTFLENGTDILFTPPDWVVVQLDRVGWSQSEGWYDNQTTAFGTNAAISLIHPRLLSWMDTPPPYYLIKPYVGIGVVIRDIGTGEGCGVSAYSPDENGCANVIVYVTPP